MNPVTPLLIMGVAGSGKTTLGRALAEARALRFVDADDLHEAAARARMASGRPLTDAMRMPWLGRVAAALTTDADIIACSALKRVYRDHLRSAVPGLAFVHLAIDPVTAGARVASRQGHFMPPVLIASQFATLEPPGADEADVLTLDAALPLAELLAILAAAR